MHLKLGYYQLKKKTVIKCKPSGNHKVKAYNKHIREKEKGIKEYHYIKSSNHKGREQKRMNKTKQKNYKTKENH